ncbi:homoserine dehydrogenase [Halobacillus sp. ACCC02827]|uniref:homoserine dehydrogenase n=1 Tax=Bacillaceae TaxID=186817 RepID=UPI0002A51830|nr:MULTISPECIES: homoserine dehydrogenase [Bacillaceae]ELK48745.1 homoserine dehydrogenase [Halobacillus sp. BAB-2008]QHT48070.1 homoserine dehydrogenase [Bacillus sp. SB49]WJE15303.1 homoserine dehydrogenase [Halobacillus sp. ACCC02827]
MKKTITVGLLGLGTVGSGVIEILRDHKERIEHKTGCDVTIKSVLVHDLDKPRELPSETKLTDRYEDITRDPDIDVVIEVMGGIDHTLAVLLEAIEHGKHIVTANKDLVAQHGAELFAACQRHNCDLYYEASVAGGIPIIRSIMDGLSSDRITKMMGIVNGTTNFIMTKMANEGVDFDSVLKEAQELGFAEADPTADVDGLDAARKMTILSILGFSMPFHLEDVHVKGIRGISIDDINFAQEMGYRIKLIGIAESDHNGVSVSVEPTLLPAQHPLASVNDEFNAVYVYGDAVGETMFYGPGAGKLPTATAVVADLISVLKNIRLGTTGTSYVQPQFAKQVKTKKEQLAKKYIRLHVDDKAGMLRDLTNIFAEYDISFDQFTQRAAAEEGQRELMMVTHQVSEEDFEKALRDLQDLDSVQGIDSVYRVEGGE